MFFISSLFYAQENKLFQQQIVIKSGVQSIDEVFHQISNQTGVQFTYNADLINGTVKLELHPQTGNLRSILNQALPDTSLEYRLINNQIVIFKKDQISIPELLQTKTELPAYYMLRGKVVDAATQESLSYATISFLSKNLGTISNEDGEFNLKAEGFANDDTLVVSYIGYENRYFKLSELVNKQNLIELNPSYVSINEVIVRYIDPERVIKDALNNVSKNYARDDVLMTSFYREGVERNNNLLIYSEAALQTYKVPYNRSFRFDQVKVLRSRIYQDYDEQDTLLLKLQAGLNSILMLDIIKEPIDFLDPEFFEFYNYHFRDVVYRDNQPTYVISFTQKNYVTDPLYEGNIYIDANSLAIVGADFQINEKYIYKASSRFIVRKSRKFRLRVLEAKYQVSYRNIDGVFYLNHVRGDIGFRIKKRHEILSSKYMIFLEMGLSNVQTTNISRFEKNEVVKLNEVFSDQQYIYDPWFWGEHNYIEPEESIKDALKRINKSLKQYSDLK